MIQKLPFSLSLISGEKIEQLLIKLAKIGGTKIPGSKELPERYSVNRVALSDEDFIARKFITGILKDVGAKNIYQHPLGIIGYFLGEDESLSPIIVESHFDSVPKAGMYDGTVGVMTSLEVLRSFKENSVRTKRSIIMIAMTGEESSGFDMALFGSRGIALGLTDKELDQSKPGGKTIREALLTREIDLNKVKTPYPLDRKSPVIEVHVGQDDRLLKSKIDLAIVENIAAPHRFQVTIGTSKLNIQDKPRYDQSKHFTIHINGKTGHSGATPMGITNRADGLVVMSDILIFSQNIKEIIKRELGKNIEVSIGGLSIEGQAMNKIPGVVSAHIRISADDKKTVAFAEKVLINFIDQRNNIYSSQPLFEKNPITISKIISNKQTGIFYDSEEMFKIHLCVGQIILHINQISNKNIYKKAKNVGTVGTYRLDDGQVTLGVDIRGVDKLMRDKMVLEITGEFKGLRYKETAGNGDPVAMDKKLVDLAYKVVKENNIGSVIKDFSPAGHDSQNFARAGHPAVMIFIPSRNGGIAHTPEEYSTPDDLQKGAQTLAALLYNL